MIKPAELPLNRRGAVYHLDLVPDELADIVITVGDPGRVRQVSRHFDVIEFTRAHREFVTHTGYFEQQRISVISTGIGVPNIDIVMNELDALMNINLTSREVYPKIKPLTIIRLGTTGSLQDFVKPGDIVLSEYAIGFDTLLNYYAFDYPPELGAFHHAVDTHLKRDCGSFYVTKANKILLDKLSALGQRAITVTCGGFYGPQGRFLRLPLQYPRWLERLKTFQFHRLNAMNLEMETAGLLGLGELMGHQCASVSVVLANRTTGEFVDNVQAHIEHLIRKALQCIRHLSSSSSS